jgi:hypothetical protein
VGDPGFTMDLVLLASALDAEKDRIRIRKRTRDAMLVKSLNMQAVSRIARFGTCFAITSSGYTWYSFSLAGWTLDRTFNYFHPGEFAQITALSSDIDNLKPRELLSRLRDLGIEINYRGTEPLTGKNIQRNVRSYLCHSRVEAGEGKTDEQSPWF